MQTSVYNGFPATSREHIFQFVSKYNLKIVIFHFHSIEKLDKYVWLILKHFPQTAWEECF